MEPLVISRVCKQVSAESANGKLIFRYFILSSPQLMVRQFGAHMSSDQRASPVMGSRKVAEARLQPQKADVALRTSTNQVQQPAEW